MAPGDERHGIGARIETGRRSHDNSTARRAINQRMENERGGATVQDDINSLVRPERKRQALPPIAPRGALPAQRGRADYKPPPKAGAGIASPVTEPSADAREHYQTVLLPTTDGMAWIRWKSIKKIVLEDANGAPVIMEYKNGLA